MKRTLHKSCSKFLPRIEFAAKQFKLCSSLLYNYYCAFFNVREVIYFREGVSKQAFDPGKFDL